MKKILQHFCIAFALTVLAALPFAAYADADKPTVVYLCDGGTGDGTSPDKAVGSLTAAYDALDLAKDCTVVVCGEFTQDGDFAYSEGFSGSVTLTSVYCGTDYRTDGAKYNVNNKRFVCTGKTGFENMTFNATGDYILVVAQHHPIKVGEGVEMTGGFKGTGVAKSFSIIGGYQSGLSSAQSSSDADTSITVLSGEKLYLVGYCRGIANADFSGKADIRIGGDAKVSQLYLSSVDSSGEFGDITVEVFGNASVEKIYGTGKTSSAESVSLLWCGGNIGALSWNNSGGTAELTVNGDKKLEATAEVQASANYNAVKEKFTKVETHTHVYDGGVVVGRATCIDEGEKCYTCTGCSAAYSETIQMVDHTPGAWKVSIPATAEREGREEQKCTYCHAVLDTRPIAKLQTTLTAADRAAIAVLASGLFKNTYTVCFDTAGVTKTVSQTVKEGGRVTIPETPVREGYTFGGWYTERAYWFEFDFGTPIRKNMTIIAKWIPNEAL